jgi:hypothetical protein
MTSVSRPGGMVLHRCSSVDIDGDQLQEEVELGGGEAYK